MKNRLINSKPVKFSKVLQIFKKQHNIRKGTNRYCINVLKATDKNLGVWIEAKLPKEVLLKILLPYHFHGSMRLIPKKGATVKEVSDRLKKIEKEYKKRSKECFKTIEYFKERHIGTIFLSSSKPNNLYDYKNMQYRRGHLIHLDGLHRLLALLSSGKIKRYSPVKCFVAIKNENKQ